MVLAIGSNEMPHPRSANFAAATSKTSDPLAQLHLLHGPQLPDIWQVIADSIVTNVLVSGINHQCDHATSLVSRPYWAARFGIDKITRHYEKINGLVRIYNRVADNAYRTLPRRFDKLHARDSRVPLPDCDPLCQRSEGSPRVAT